MSKFPTAFLQSASTDTGGTKCAPVVFSPDSGTMPINVNLSTTEAGGHIFYRIANNDVSPPVHVGDSATSPTVRIGSNSGTISVTQGTGLTRTVKAVCYLPGKLDSDITGAGYDAPESGG